MTNPTIDSASETVDSPPVYKRKEVPAHLQHLRTATELKGQRLKPTAGQKPLALLRVYRSGHGWGEFPLYDPAGAAPMRPLSAKQQAAVTARRTCPECREVGSEVVQTMCGACWTRKQREQEDRRARTCLLCSRVAAAPHPRDRGGRCAPCWLLSRIHRQFEAERFAVWSRTCPGRDCQKVTATDEEIATGRTAGTWRGPRWCPQCAERDERERAEQLRADQEARENAAEARRRAERDLTAWAREVLDDPDTVVLDTETTGVHAEARIVEIGVQRVSGEVLVDTLIDPGEPIPAEATAIHGITDAMVAEAGVPAFGEVVDRLAAALAGKRVVIYNRRFDVGRLRHELARYYAGCVSGQDAQETVVTGTVAAEERDQAAMQAAAWIDGMRFEDAMDPFSTWVGEWSHYWGDYVWQPLPGGDHRALGDCRAVVTMLRRMASGAG